MVFGGIVKAEDERRFVREFAVQEFGGGKGVKGGGGQGLQMLFEGRCGNVVEFRFGMRFGEDAVVGEEKKLQASNSKLQGNFKLQARRCGVHKQAVNITEAGGRGKTEKLTKGGTQMNTEKERQKDVWQKNVSFGAGNRNRTGLGKKMGTKK